MNKEVDKPEREDLLQSIVALIDRARKNVALAVNSELTLLYWNIGKQINENILTNDRADYGKNIILKLSEKLKILYGSGFNKRNLQSFIKFSAVFQDVAILHTLCAILAWSHIRELIYIKEDLKRDFYAQMCIHEHWSVRTLQGRMESMIHDINRICLLFSKEQMVF